MEENIYPFFDGILEKSDKELLLRQRSKVLWMSGLSGAGKSTIAKELEKRLYSQGFLTLILDGDNIRVGINNNLGFSDNDRTENIRRIAEVSKLIVNSGVIVINSFISPNEKVREMAQEIIGKENFVNIYINASLACCEKRDIKGLYKKARKGEIANFTGIDSVFEPPLSADIEIPTDEQTVEESVNQLLEFILPLITYQ
ncbi:MAG: adenylyl-sulfate kinase [Bacteroidales bacterium]|nr:adenylyl-sulfate kinase [Bacteroidales bacterium]